MRSRIGLATVTVLVMAACSSSGGLGAPETSTAAATDHPTTTTSSGPVEVTADGDVLTFQRVDEPLEELVVNDFDAPGNLAPDLRANLRKA